MTRVLVLGASGMLGSSISIQLQEDFHVTGTYFRGKEPQFLTSTVNQDLSDDTKLEDLIATLKPDIIINCAGLTDVDGCETAPETAWRLNAFLPYQISKIARSYGFYFIHISTDHFKSHSKFPRSETSEMFPVNKYGLTKLAGEDFIQAENREALIIRTNFFGLSYNKKNSLLDFLKDSFSLKKSVTGFEDVFFTPISVTMFSKILMTLVSKKYYGILHVAGNQCISKYNFARMVATQLEVEPYVLRRASISDSKLRAIRPNYLCLDNALLKTMIPFQIPDLQDMIRTELRKSST
jgi:dTDP-4-dehydrorhamnose reductase